MPVRDRATAQYCGRVFTLTDLELIRSLIGADPGRNRTELSRVVCDGLGWVRPDGRRKDMSCRVAMLRMARDGLITLPPPRNRNGNGRTRPRVTAASDARQAFTVPAHAIDLRIRAVFNRRESSLWNELIERYHPLGYTPLCGAQARYLAFSGEEHILAAVGFGAAAWKLAPRDGFIGWTREQRCRNLQRIVNNVRFLIPPWVRSPNLASRLLADVTRRLPRDWEARYGLRPVLLETFVEKDRYRGTCYRAANWICVGETQGRGKLDQHHRRALPVKQIFVYPLERTFRRQLCSPQ
jgi:hypothetical protein